MFAPFLFALAQATAPAAADAAKAPPTEEAIAVEVVAINKLLDKWKGGIYRKDGKLTCRMQQSSGDNAIDLLRCGAMVGCYAPKADELDAIAASDATKEERVAQMKAISEETQACLDSAHRQGVRRLAEVRAAL